MPPSETKHSPKEKGAVVIILVNGYVPKNDDDLLMDLRYDGAPRNERYFRQQVKEVL